MIGSQDLRVGLVIVLVLFGAKKLPELAASLGPAADGHVAVAASSHCPRCGTVVAPKWFCPWHKQPWAAHPGRSDRRRYDWLTLSEPHRRLVPRPYMPEVGDRAEYESWQEDLTSTAVRRAPSWVAPYGASRSAR
jgi:hypothetical protein